MSATMSQHMGRYSTAQSECQETMSEVLRRVGGSVAMPLEELARMCGFSVPTASSAVHKVEDDGRIVIERGRPNRYRLFGKESSTEAARAKVVTPENDEVVVIKHV